MALSFEEFKRLVPKETSDFFIEMLPTLEHYKNGAYIEVTDANQYFSDVKEKGFLVMLYYACKHPKIGSFLGILGFNEDRYRNFEEKKSSTDLEKLYKENCYWIPEYDDKTEYGGLTIYEILDKAIDDLRYRLDASAYYSLFNLGQDGFQQKIKEQCKKEDDLVASAVEKEVYANVPISVINLIENASKIRSIIINNADDYKKEGIKIVDDDLVPLSILLSLYYCAQNNDLKREGLDLSEYQEIINYFDSKGIRTDKFIERFGFYTRVKVQPRNIYAVKELYRKYLGSCNTQNLIPINVLSVIEKVLDRDFTDSIIIEKLFSSFDCDISLFKDIRSFIETSLTEKKRKQLSYFYNNVPKKTAEYIEHVTLIYQCLKEQIADPNHHDNYISSDDDIVLLAFLMSNYHDTHLYSYLSANGITQKSIAEMFNIKPVSRSDLENKKLDEDLMLDKFVRFALSGVCKDKEKSQVTIDDCCLNACYENFTHSELARSLFNEYSNGINASGGFGDKLVEYFKFLEKERLSELEASIFSKLPLETVEFLSNASRTYGKVKNGNVNLSDKEIIIFSCLLSYLNKPGENDENLINFLNKHEITILEICKYLGVEKNVFLGEVDLDLIKDKYDALVHETGNYFGKSREEMTPSSILQYALNGVFADSYKMNSFLQKHGLSQKHFLYLEQTLSKYFEELEEERKKQQMEQKIALLSHYPNGYIKNCERIYARLLKAYENDEFSDGIVAKKEDLIPMTIVLLDIFFNYNNREIYADLNGLNITSFLEACGLPPNFLGGIEDDEVSYEYLTKELSPFVDKFKEFNLNICALEASVFDDSFASSQVIKRIALKNRTDFNALKRVIEEKRPKQFSSINDCYKRLQKTQVANLDGEDMSAIMEWGDFLMPHAENIKREVNSLAQEEVKGRIVNETLSALYWELEKPKPRSFINSFFNNSVDEKSDDSDAFIEKLNNLKRVVTKNALELKKEVLHFDCMRRYIEEFMHKSDMSDEAVRTRLARIDTTDLDLEKGEEFAASLANSSIKTILHDKLNRSYINGLLMRRDLLRTNKSLIDNYVILEALEIAQYDLLPLLENEQTGDQQLSRVVLNLVSSLLKQDVDGATKGLEIINEHSLTEDVLKVINHDLDTYLEGVKRIDELHEHIVKMDSEIASPSPEKVKKIGTNPNS